MMGNGLVQDKVSLAASMARDLSRSRWTSHNQTKSTLFGLIDSLYACQYHHPKYPNSSSPQTVGKQMHFKPAISDGSVIRAYSGKLYVIKSVFSIDCG